MVERCKQLETARVGLQFASGAKFGDALPIEDAVNVVLQNRTPSPSREIDGVPMTEFGSFVAHPDKDRAVTLDELPPHLRGGPNGVL